MTHNDPHRDGPDRDGPDRSVPYIDVDEWRDRPRRHRYVHGGFEGTHLRFSFYLPPAERYEGRFFQYLEGGAGGHENLLATGGRPVAWIFDLAFDEFGGYLVESNQGHFPGEGLGFGNDHELYGASAQTAVYGRELAAAMYGAAPHHGYVWGISGGGARSGHCLENRPDVWQGGVPHAGIGQSTQWSPWALTWLLARDRFPQIIDAAEPGGSGEVFAGLTHPQREALAELYRRGWPRGAENQLAPFTAWAFPMYATKDADPTYFDDFWNQPGYRGHDDPGLLDALVVDETATVERIVPAAEVGNLFAQMEVRLATAGAAGNLANWGLTVDLPGPERLFMATVTVLTGRAAGRELLVSGVDDGVLSPFSERTPELFSGVEPGDQVRVDNRDFVAWCHYHWYTIGGGEPGAAPGDVCLEPWAVDGRPVYPQRSIGSVSQASPTSYKATLTNKMIYVQPTSDAQVWPTTIFPYDARIRANLADRVDEHYRLWFVQNSPHGTPEFIGPATTSERDPGVWRGRLVSYDGVTAQALRDVIRWVEDDVAPPFYTGVHLTRDNALVYPPTAAGRGGVQPVVTVAVDGAALAEIRVGESVALTGTGEQPPGAGAIVAAEWDFEGRGDWAPADTPVDGASSTVSATVSHTYTAPGTYFAGFRVGAHRDGAKGRGPLAQNLARARVVVTP